MNTKFDLLSTVESGGCSAKLPAGMLKEIVNSLPQVPSDKLLVGNDTCDDALVYRISNDTAIIQTTDFFPPVCSDPYGFGQIAAANALSDIYAMGGTAITALNLVMFPSAVIDISVLEEILKGGADKVIEAGAVLAGGHTIDGETPVYGLAVTGVVHPDRIIANSNARPGDLLVLTKGLGTGILNAGIKMAMADDSHYRASLESMKQLNRAGAVIMQKYNVRSATDVTGFSLCGHALEMAQASGVCITLNSNSFPLLDGVYDLVDQGCIPGASFRNLQYVEKLVTFSDKLDYNLKMTATDAQTSGGLLMCCREQDVSSLLDELHSSGYTRSAIVGEVTGLQNDQTPIAVI